MKGKVFLGQYLIWVIVLLGQLHGYKSCIQKERKALLELKQYLISISEEGQSDYVLTTWTNDTKSQCCRWEGVKCSRTSGRVTKIAFGDLFLKESSFFNLSLLHPFEEVQSLDLSECAFSALFDDIEGYKSLSRLRKLEILDLSSNEFNNSIFPFLNAATSLKTLFLGFNKMDGPFPVKVFCGMKNLQELYLSGNYFSGQVPQCLGSLNKLHVLDLSLNQLSGNFPSSIGEMKNISFLDLSHNKLSGVLPRPLFTGCFSLQILQLSHNQLGGDVLPGQTNLTSLAVLRMDNNLFTGEIGDGLLTLVNLSVLDMSNNLLRGSVPILIPNSSDMFMLLLSNNLLEGTLPSSLLANQHLNFLDLSGNLLSGALPSYDSSMYGIKLFLHNNSFTGEIPRTLLNLLFLDVSVNDFNHNFPENIGWILPSLRYINFKDSGSLCIYLRRGHTSTRKFNKASSAATSLTTLFLRGNKMDGHFPAKELRDLTNLKLLDLSGNNFSGSIRVRDMTPLKQLKALDLRGNKFSASTDLQGICELKNLLELDFSKNKLVGNFPLCLTSLTGLRVLDLSSNQLTGTIPFALGNLKSLEYLSLFDNNFEGLFSLGSLTNLSELRVLKLSSKSNSFQVVSESSWKPKFQLSVISLRSCILEKVPPFLRYQKELHEIYLSDNRISENFPSWLLANNTNLEILHLKNNSFTSFQLPSSGHSLIFLDVSVNKFNNLFPINIGWILPSLRYINISNNGFHGELPSSLGNMKGIEFLDISHNSFHGKLPRSFLEGCYSLTILKMSHNKLSGEILPKATNFTDMLVLSMDNNQFTGNIGQGLRSLRYMLLLDISNNNLTGVFPSWFGDFPYMNALLVANNMLEGEIPTALFNITYLQLLDLSANMLSGSIPPRLNSTNQVALFLQDNNLSGSIPNTLLVNIRILDLRNNRLSGNIPELINTQNINILLLRGNNLSGRIPRQLCALRSIHLLDLANNRLNGSIPLCLGNTSFGSFCLGKENASYSYDVGMAFTDVFPSSTPDSTSTGNVGTYVKSLLVLDQFSMDYEAATQTKIEFATKHRYDAYMGGNLRYLFGMDLSENELSGEVPVELGGLLELYALNLSHNYLTGAIPKSFSGMKNMESLDLSFNRLQGHIPPQLTELSSLAVFNVSFNNLSGVIPLGKQFNTFDSQSYLGNPLLCGKPTNMSCESNNFHEPDNGVEAEETTIDMVSFYWSLAAAYVTILLGIFTSLSFDSPWSRLWFYNIDAFIHKAGNFLC
ncbi:hypothetical protein Bca4012_101883 [Brassica carinata]